MISKSYLSIKNSTGTLLFCQRTAMVTGTKNPDAYEGKNKVFSSLSQTKLNMTLFQQLCILTPYSTIIVLTLYL